MRKKDRSLLVALVLQVAALAFVALLYLYLRGVATENRSPVIPLPAGGAEESPADRGPEAPRLNPAQGARLGRVSTAPAAVPLAMARRTRYYFLPPQ